MSKTKEKAFAQMSNRKTIESIWSKKLQKYQIIKPYRYRAHIENKLDD